jgi:hypothetical protein
MFESSCFRLDYANRTVCALYHIRAILLREVVSVASSLVMPVSLPAPTENRLLAALTDYRLQPAALGGTATLPLASVKPRPAEY